MWSMNVDIHLIVGIIGDSVALAGFAAVASRWVWRKHVKPFLVEQLSELQANGGASMRDLMQRVPAIQESINQNHEDAQAHWAKLEKVTTSNLSYIRDLQDKQEQGAKYLGIAFRMLDPDLQQRIQDAVDAAE